MTQQTDRGLTRRDALRGAFAVGGAAALAAAGGGTAWAAGATGATTAAATAVRIPDVADTSHATPRLARLVRDLYAAKSAHDATRLSSFYADPEAFFVDAVLGLGVPNWAALNGFFTSFFASGLPAAAISYPLRVIGDERSAVVEFVDTPEFFGLDQRVLTSLTFDRNLKIVRAVDYWDGRTSLTRNAIGPGFPTDFQDQRQNAASVLVRAVKALQAAFAAGDAAGAAALLSYDVVVEDLAAHTRLQGNIVALRYFARALAQLPYGVGASVAHVSGGMLGGGYEWAAGPAGPPLRRGHTAVELDAAGRISRLSVMYDSSVLADAQYRALVALAAEAPL